MSFWVHTYQIVHLTLYTDYERVKKNNYSILNLFNYALMCAMIFLWQGLFLLITSGISISGYFYYCCDCCLPKSEKTEKSELEATQDRDTIELSTIQQVI